MILKDSCTSENVTLEKAIEHIFEYELRDDKQHNLILFDSIKNLKIATLNNFREVLTIDEKMKLAAYYDYEFIKI